MPDLRLGLIGDNISRLKAPLLHQLARKLMGLEVRYDRLIPKDLSRDFDGVFEDCGKEGYRGINVTYPYKERVVPKVRINDSLVRALGAINTVVFASGGPTGHNTDYSGFRAAYRGVAGDAAPGAVCMIGASWAFDAVYTPIDTQFLKDAKAEGLTIISGYELFFYQGLHVWEIFSGRPIDETRLRHALSEAGDASV